MRTLGFRSSPDLTLAAADNFSVQIEFADGGVGTVQYAADSPTGPGKERFETSAPGAYGLIDNFGRGEVWRGRDRSRLGGRTQDKGFAGQYELVARVVRGEAEAPRAESFYVSTLVTLAAARSLETAKAEIIFEPLPGREATAGTELAGDPQPAR